MESDCTPEDAVDANELLELVTCYSKESLLDVQFGQQLSPLQGQEVRSLVRKYKQVFTDIPGGTDIIQHRILLTSDDQARSRPYPVPYHVRETRQWSL